MARHEAPADGSLKMSLPAQRWEGSAHSAANAISAALKVLESGRSADCNLTVHELVGICSELVFRTTGERIRPVSDCESANCPTSLISWRRCSEAMPEDDRLVLVRFDDDDTLVAYRSQDGAWHSDYHGGNHPGAFFEEVHVKRGRRTVFEQAQRVVPIVAWAYLP